MRAVILDYPSYGPWDFEAEAARRAGIRLEVAPYERFAAAPTHADIVLNAGGWPLPPPLISRIPGCRCAVGYGVGLDWIDIEDATRRGILVANMPLANTEEVATHTLGLILACARRLLDLDRTVRDGRFEWPRTRPMHRLQGRTLGFLAFGNIARRVAILSAPLGLTLRAYDPHVPPAAMQAVGVEPTDLDGLLGTAAILSVHLPSAPETRGMLDDRALALLPQGSILVVTSRGDVYDLDAVARALDNGRLAAAGLDVFPEEPVATDHPLLRLPNVVLTPHVAGYSEESIRDQHSAAAAVLAALARGATPPGAVNPEVMQ